MQPSLLHRIQFENDEMAVREFYEANVFRLFQFAFAFVQNRELSEEIVNDVFLKLWRNRGRIDQIDNLSVYLYVAVKNTANNYLRQTKGRLTADLGSQAVHHFYLSPDPEQLLVTDELRRRIEAAIGSLIVNEQDRRKSAISEKAIVHGLQPANSAFFLGPDETQRCGRQ